MTCEAVSDIWTIDCVKDAVVSEGRRSRNWGGKPVAWWRNRVLDQSTDYEVGSVDGWR
jgi:hypothetical protein